MNSSVLLISHGFQPCYEKSFANALAHHGVAVTLAASVRTDYAHLDPRVTTVNLVRSMDPSRTIAQKIKTKLAYIIELAELVLRHRRSVAHLIGTYLTASVLLGIIELALYRVLSSRLVMTVHNLLPHDRHSALNFLAAWVAYRIPHVLIVHTHKMRDELIANWRVSQNKIVVMEHGVDDIPESHTQWAPDPEGTLHLLMFGGVARYKGVDVALEAVARIKDRPIHLAIVGACRDASYERELRHLMDLVAPPSRVEWLSTYIPEEQVQSHFDAADAVLLPYRHIDQSGVLFAAFRFGAPVIAFDVGSFRDYVVSNIGTIASTNDVPGLVSAICAFADRTIPIDRAEIKMEAQRFLWTNTVTAALAAYCSNVCCG